METKNLYENGPNNLFCSCFNLMGTRMVQICIANKNPFDGAFRNKIRPTLIMETKNLYESGPNNLFCFYFNLMGTRMVQIRIASKKTVR